jgi:hypothetical protein
LRQIFPPETDIHLQHDNYKCIYIKYLCLEGRETISYSSGNLPVFQNVTVSIEWLYKCLKCGKLQTKSDILTNHVERVSCCKPYSHSVAQEIPCLLQNSPALLLCLQEPILSQVIQCITSEYSFMFQYYVVLIAMPRFHNWPLHIRF